MELINLLVTQGKFVNIVPKTTGLNHTELYSKVGTGLEEYIGCIIHDSKLKKYVLFELHEDMQMSLDCLKEAFELTEKYWSEKTD